MEPRNRYTHLVLNVAEDQVLNSVAACNTYSPIRLGLSGKNSDSTGSTQACLRMMGFTREATRCKSGSALSALRRSLRCVNDFTKV